jgi:hypothetical protein
MPLFPYLSIIIWMGMIKVMLGATDDDAQSMADPTDVTMNRAGIIAFRAPRTATADLLLRQRPL